MKKLLIGIAVLALAVFSQAQRGQGMGMMMGQGGGNPRAASHHAAQPPLLSQPDGQSAHGAGSRNVRRVPE